MTISEPVRRLERELRGIFGPRLSSLSIYATAGAGAAETDHGGHHPHGHRHPPTHTLAVVDSTLQEGLMEAMPAKQEMNQ